MTDDAKLLAQIDQWLDAPRWAGFTAQSLMIEARDRIAALERQLAEAQSNKDAAYLERNQVVAALATMVIRSGSAAGIKRTAIEGWSDDWHGCIFMDLPTGQASWHYHDSHAHLFNKFPQYAGEWDGHTTPEKYGRMAALLDKGADLIESLAEANQRVGELEDDVHRRSKQYNELYEQLAEARKVPTAPYGDLVCALRNYEQADEEGIVVKVSRQACHEAAQVIEHMARTIPREPTNLMLMAGWNIHHDHGTCAAIWRRMHDAALAQPEGEKK